MRRAPVAGHCFAGQRTVARVAKLCALILLAAPGIHAAGCSDPPAQIMTGYRDMYDLNFTAAHREFEEWKRAHPEDPMGPMSNAAAFLFAEFERLHILESEFFTNDAHFESDKKLVADPNVKAQFDVEIRFARESAARFLSRTPNDPGAMLAQLLSAGLESDYLALIEKKYINSLDHMKSSRKTAEQLLAAHPECADAYLAIGIENYVLSLKPMPVRWLLRMGGAHTDQSVGVDTLKKTAANGRLLQPFAQLLLAVEALRRKDRDEARSLLRGLSTEFPHNHLYAVELAKLGPAKKP